jgi:dephospho-CoA kinase
MMTIALTGSIGMGKSTAARAVAEEGIPVWDADAAVHRLYGPGAAGAEAIARLAPDAVTEAGVDRARLRAALIANADLMPDVEAAIHPLVARDREAFLERVRAEGAWAALCDIPLLFETGGQGRFDVVIVVSAPAEAQRERVLQRPGMTEAAFEAILARQMPDARKRALADFVIDTGQDVSEAKRQMQAVLAQLRQAAATGEADA